MENIVELRNELLDNFEKLKSKQMDLKMGKELTNAAGKVINSAKLELEYNTFIGNKEPISFLQTVKKKKTI